MRRPPLPLVLLLAACGGGQPPAAAEEAPAGSGWEVRTVFTVEGKLGGCAVGDVDPTREGDEIVAVASTGKAYVAWATAEGWRHETIAETPGEMVQVAVGDADPTRPGLEVVMVGMAKGTEDDPGAGAAWMAWKEEGLWRQEVLLEDVALLHAVAIGDVDVRREGPEVLVAGFGRTLHVLHREGDGWEAQGVAALEGAAKNAVPYRSGALLVDTSGAATYLSHEEEGWQVQAIYQGRAGLARLTVREGRVLLAGDDGALVLLEGTGTPQRIHAEDQKLRGAVLADLDRTGPGFEAATTGYGRRITLLRRDLQGWEPRVLHEDAARFHHLAAWPADEPRALVACAVDGRLLLLEP